MTTTSELIDKVRTDADEENTSSVTNPSILKELNRAQRKATNIISRKYPDLFWKENDPILTVGGQSEYSIPPTAAGRRIMLVEIQRGSIRQEVVRIENAQRTRYFTRTMSQSPQYYSLVKNKLVLFPTPSNGQTMYIHTVDRPQTLVVDQGRITDVNVAGNYILTDVLAPDISTQVEGFASYVNFVDYQSGDIKATLQVQTIDPETNQYVFKTSGLTRSTVLGMTIATAIPDTVAQDDYVCLVTGTCVPEIDDVYEDFLVQDAVTTIRRRLGLDVQAELIELERLEKELEKMWVERPQSFRVKKTGNHFNGRIGSTWGQFE